nr:hypothetical protein SCJ30.08 - Streptomyces coelicolor [Streptomyces coelicolor]
MPVIRSMPRSAIGLPA